MYYSAFGLNTNVYDMSNRCPSAQLIGKAVVPDYQLKFRYHADIESAPGKNLEVCLWEITDEDLKCLDALEGFPTYYTRLTVPVIYNSQSFESLIYIMNDQSYEEVPHKSYLGLCIQGYTENSMDVSQLEIAYNSALQYYNGDKHDI